MIHKNEKKTDHQRYLQQAAQLILILYTRERVDESSLVRDRTITSDEDVVSDGLSENLDFEDISDDFFCLSVDVGVHKGDVVVACDDVSEGGETFLDTLDGDGIGERISQVL